MLKHTFVVIFMALAAVVIAGPYVPYFIRFALDNPGFIHGVVSYILLVTAMAISESDSKVES